MYKAVYLVQATDKSGKVLHEYDETFCRKASAENYAKAIRRYQKGIVYKVSIHKFM